MLILKALLPKWGVMKQHASIAQLCVAADSDANSLVSGSRKMVWAA